jgi:HSP20 family molecular chaperone IbpA
MQSIVAREDERESQSSSTSVSILATHHFSDRLAEIQQSIAGRAYQLFEDRGQLDGHDLEDWLRAESEILLPIYVRTYDFDDSLITRVQVPLPTADDIEVQVEERRIVICDRGPLYADSEHDAATFKRLFQCVALPQRVDWSSAEVTFKDGVLEVSAPKLSEEHSFAA